MANSGQTTATGTGTAAPGTTAPATAPKANLYRLKPGKKHFLGGSGDERKYLHPGETIELTASQAKAFADKFEKV